MNFISLVENAKPKHKEYSKYCNLYNPHQHFKHKLTSYLNS